MIGYHKNMTFNKSKDAKGLHLEKINEEDLKKLKKWNWGAFLLPLFWSLANKLDLLAALSMIPFLNVIVIFYLGFYGNRLAYPRSKLDSVDDFMAIQKYWSKWGFRFLLIFIVCLTVVLLVEIFQN